MCIMSFCLDKKSQSNIIIKERLHPGGGVTKRSKLFMKKLFLSILTMTTLFFMTNAGFAADCGCKTGQPCKCENCQCQDCNCSKKIDKKCECKCENCQKDDCEKCTCGDCKSENCKKVTTDKKCDCDCEGCKTGDCTKCTCKDCKCEDCKCTKKEELKADCGCGCDKAEAQKGLFKKSSACKKGCPVK